MNAIKTHELTRAFGQRIVVDSLTLAIPTLTVIYVAAALPAALIIMRADGRNKSS